MVTAANPIGYLLVGLAATEVPLATVVLASGLVAVLASLGMAGAGAASTERRAVDG